MISLCCTIFVYLVLRPICIEAGSSEDAADPIIWKTNGLKAAFKYENVNLQQNSFLAVCLADHFKGSSDGTEGVITLKDTNGATRFEWKSYDGNAGSNRIRCHGRVAESTYDICYTTEESNCTVPISILEEHFSFGHCDKALSIIISEDSFAISCGDIIVRAPRCSDGSKETWNIEVAEFGRDVCATRLRSVNSSWIDVLSGENLQKTINFGTSSLLIQHLMIRENDQIIVFTARFKEVGKVDDGDVITVNVTAKGSLAHTTYVYIDVMACGNSSTTGSNYIGDRLGENQIEMSLIEGQIELTFKNGDVSDVIQLPSCDKLQKDLTMVFEDPDGNRNLSLVGNTNIKIVQKASCLAGYYMIEESGCQLCRENTFSAKGAPSCTNCPDGKSSEAGSTSENDCEYAPCNAGNYMTDSGCQQCEGNTYSADGASSCTSCPKGKGSLAGSTSESDCKNVSESCVEPNITANGLSFVGQTVNSFLIGLKVPLACKDPTYQINGNNTITCQSNKTWTKFPSCTKKTCGSGKSLTTDGRCSGCPKGHYAKLEDGAEFCQHCKTEGDKHYTDEVGSVTCKKCDGEVDSGRTLCVQRKDGKNLPTTDSEAETKHITIIYITMGVVAMVVHAVVIVIGNWRNLCHSSDNKGNDYFSWRVKKYNSTKIAHRKFSNQDPETSDQRTPPDTVPVPEGQPIGEGDKSEEGQAGYSCRKQSHDDDQAASSSNKMAVIDMCEVPDHLYDDLEGLKTEKICHEDPGPVKDSLEISIPMPDEPQSNMTETESLSKVDKGMSDGESSYEEISDIPLPSQVKNRSSGYEEVIIPPLSTENGDPPPKNKGKSTLKKNKNEAAVDKTGTLNDKKTLDLDLTLDTLKKDGTLKKDLTKKKSASLDERDSTLKRNTIKKNDDAIVSNREKQSDAINLDKEFADIQKMLQFDDWTEDTKSVFSTPSVTHPTHEQQPTSSTSKSNGEDEEEDDIDLDVSYTDNTYAVMEYAGEPIQLYESMASASTLKTYNDITSLSRTDEDGVERYVPLGTETEEDAVYTRSTRQIAKRSDEEGISKE